MGKSIAVTMNTRGHKEMNLPEGFPSIVKDYPRRGPFSLCRVESHVVFHCSRCQQDKASKLVAVREGDEKSLLCNGCYGLLVAREEGK